MMKYCTQISLIKTGLSIVILLAGSVSGQTTGTAGQTSATVPYGEGAFEVDLTPISNKYCLVNVEGECGGQTVEVEVLLEDENAGYVPDPGQPAIAGTAWENVLFAAGELTLGGNVTVSGDTLHSNGELAKNGAAGDLGEGHLTSSTSIRINGNNTMIGSLTAPSIDANVSGVTENIQDVPQKAFPEMDFTALYNQAVNSGLVINGDKKVNSTIDWSGTPVVWVNGDLTANGQADLISDGIVVVTGNISINGGVNWSQDYSNTMIISRDGSIKVGGNAEIKGLLYAPGDITLCGNVLIEGQVLSGENLTVNGSVEIIDYIYSGPDHPGIDAGNPLTPSIKIGAWQK